jgi:hypothetical protein
MEKDIRLFILFSLGARPGELIKLYTELEIPRGVKPEMMSFDMKKRGKKASPWRVSDVKQRRKIAA